VLYQVVAARRQNFESMVWQVPALSLTAQAFLLVIALGSGSGHLARIAAGLLSAVTALMSVQLLLRQRLHERADSIWLNNFEDSRGWEARPRPSRWCMKWPPRDLFPFKRELPLLSIQPH
jgi:hypothetical protein